MKQKFILCSKRMVLICTVMVKDLFLIGIFGIFTQGMIFAQSHYPGQNLDKLTLNDRGMVKAYSFDLTDVRLKESIFTENMRRDGKWMLSLEDDRLLLSFYLNAGMDFPNYFRVRFKGPKLGGWESLDCEVRGHTVGHILSGLALIYASTGEEVYKTKSENIVSILAEVQRTLNQDGYLSAFPQEFINRNLAGKVVWAPWYVIHKLCAGLIDQYLFCDNEQALDIVKKMADWAYKKLDPVGEAQRAIMLRREFGGMNDAFYALYAITGKPEYKKLAEFFYDDALLDPLKAGEDILKGKHANTFIPKIIGTIRGYELEGKEDYKTISDFFWNTVINHQSYCTGSNSSSEGFFEPGMQSKYLGTQTGESCNVYNMLKLTHHLFCANPDARYADYYEKALYNHILGQQDPESGMVHYYLPMLPGAYKVYSSRDSSFWCCIGTGFESHVKYGEAIYFNDENGLYVNLFIPSELNWEKKGIKIVQETNYPDEETIRLIVNTNGKVSMPLYVRYPSWAVSGATVKVNGQNLNVRRNKPGSYIIINRDWKNGDKVEITYPMTLHLMPTSDDPNVVAVFYGPIVLAAQMGKEGMVAPAPFHDVKTVHPHDNQFLHLETISNKLNVKGQDLSAWLKKVEGEPLVFKTVASITAKEYKFIPLYRIHRERYIVYWEMK